MPERDAADGVAASAGEAGPAASAAGERRPARRSRRASTAPVPGSDPTPQADAHEAAVRAAEDAPQGWGDAPAASDANDDRLRLDRPPHWG
jgi:high-mobility group nucleosome-binding domain-containing protein 2